MTQEKINILDQISEYLKEERPLIHSREDDYLTPPKQREINDLTNPPGLVGEVTKYINSQCRYPREFLSVLSAITTVANIGGLNHKLEGSKITSNLFAFAVAGSATGKEAVLQAVTDLHVAAGMSAAVHGSIKSEQEIVRNLTRNQAAFYCIDEFGLFLRKLNLSHKQGGASYLQGVIGMLMAAYSKAGGNFLLSGDMKDDIRAALKKEYAALNKELDDGIEDAKITERMGSIKKSMDELDKGLVNPFLSLLGFTTPTTFNESISFEQVTSGFIGRSIIILEPDNNPKRKRGFASSEMPEDLIDKLVALKSNGSFDKTSEQRVESNGNYNIITTTQEAKDALEEYADWFEDQAEKHTEKTGFEAVVRRGYEMVEKVSFILAFGESERTLKHVDWAFDYIKRDIEIKTMLAYSNVKEKSDPVESMAAKIMSIADYTTGITIGKIKNRFRSKKEIVQEAVDMLERKGRIRIESTGRANFIFRN